MLTLLLILRLILAFTVGSVWVTAVTVLAERKGTAWAILGGLPSTAAFSLLFIAVNQGVNAAFEATTVLPVVFSVSNASLLLYAVSAKKSFKVGLCTSLTIWFIVSGVTVASGVNNYLIGLAVSSLISALTFLAFTKLKLPRFSTQSQLYKKIDILYRGIVAGVVVSLAVLLSQIGGPLVGGVAAAFPAVYISTITILNHSQGTEFSRSVTKPLAFSGILTVIPYTIAVHYLYPSVGIWVGTILSYLSVMPLAFLAYYAVQRST